MRFDFPLGCDTPILKVQKRNEVYRLEKKKKIFSDRA